ncbi:MAG TPA: outer membrane beta-barrel protein [Pedobacter sp.]|nr:outer membrane beta-barrel protein [Pedobacter sp.]
MKQSTKFLATAVAAVALFFSTNVNAQSTPKFGIGLNLGVPTSNAHSFAIAGDLRYQFDLSKQLSIPITAGYTRLMGAEIGNTGVDAPDRAYIPVKAGLKYFFNDTGAGVYGLAEAGAAFAVGAYSGTNFVYSPALGYAWSNGLDLAAKFEGISEHNLNTGYFGLRLAYGFKL